MNTANRNTGPLHVIRLEGDSGGQYVRVRAYTPADAVALAMKLNTWASRGQWLRQASPAQVEEFDRMGASELIARLQALLAEFGDLAADRFQELP